MPVRYTVKPGDCLSSIARAHGFASWRTIYDDPDNAAFRARRSNPNILAAGDEIVIPDKTSPTATLATGSAHKIVISLPRFRLDLELRGFDGQPLVGVKYKLEVGGKETIATTGTDGRVMQPLESVVAKGTLTVWLPGRKAPRVFDLQIGDLDPISTFRGVEQRLANLGYGCPVNPPSKTVPPTLDPFVRAFKCHAGLPMDPIAELTLRTNLVKRHGC